MGTILTLGRKAGRVLRLLLGVSTPRVASSLAAYGFGEKDVNEGWERLRALSGRRFASRASAAPDPSLLERLDAFENQWFPVARATLRRHHPEVGDWLFDDLDRTESLDVALSVGTFLDRLARLEKLDLPGAGAALILLARRGLTDGVVAEARSLLGQLPKGRESPVARGVTPGERRAAEEALWSWYLEWSQIARVAIHDPRLLARLGLLRPELDEADAIDSDELVLPPLVPQRQRARSSPS